MIPPDLWRNYPFVDLQRVGVIVALTLSSGALAFSGGVMLNVGCMRLGISMLAVAVITLVGAAQVER